MLSKKTRSWRNRSGSVSCEPNHRAYPLSVEEIQSEVLRCTEEGERLRVVGAGHALSPLCHSDENQMSLRDFHGLESADLERRRVWVRSGTPMRVLGELLQERGLALESPGDLSGTVGGAISTGAHGSGLGFGNLSTQVTALQLVCAGGRVRSISREENAEMFDAARLSLGALGVITHIELQCVDAYRLHCQTLRAPLEETLVRLDEYLLGYRNFEFRWFPYSETAQLRFMDSTQRPARGLQPVRRARELAVENGALWMMSEVARHLPALSERVSRAAAQGRASGEAVLDWQQAHTVQRLVPRTQTEYSIPLERLPKVIRQIDRLISALKFRVHFPLEVRFVQGDDLWLSPAYQRDSAAIAVHMYRGMPYEDYFAAVAEIFDRNDGRPHWASLHDKTAHELRGLYPRFEDFCALRHELDPRGVFLNGHLAALFDVHSR